MNAIRPISHFAPLSRAEAAWHASRPSHIQNAMPALSMPRGGVPFLAYHIPSGDCVAHGRTLTETMANARLDPVDLEVLRMEPIRVERLWFYGSRLKHDRLCSETMFRGTACESLDRRLEAVSLPVVGWATERFWDRENSI